MEAIEDRIFQFQANVVQYGSKGPIRPMTHYLGYQLYSTKSASDISRNCHLGLGLDHQVLKKKGNDQIKLNSVIWLCQN